MQQFPEFVMNHPILFAALAVILVMLATNLFQALAGGARQIGASLVTQLINRDEGVIVDIRDKSAFSQGHVMGAINLPFERLAERVGELEAFRAKAIIVCCNDGLVSPKAGRTLVKAGFTKVYRLQGGIMEWRNANLPLARG